MARIALYGGTFDPVHAGHGIVACELLNAHLPDGGGLIDEVWLVPCGSRVDKRIQATPEQRLAMLQLFLEAYFSPEERIRINSIEIWGPAMLTIELYRKMCSFHAKHQFFVVIGADNVLPIVQGEWAGASELLAEVPFIVCPRVGYPAPEVMKERVGLGPGKFFPLNGDVIATSTISSSLIRRYFEERKCLSSILPLSVINFIRRNQLYGCASPAH